MKIDLFGTYLDSSRLAGASSHRLKPARDEVPFEATLAALGPNAPKSQQKAELKNHYETEDTRAALKQLAGRFIPPELEPLGGKLPLESPPEVSEQPTVAPVKAPTLLSAKRVPSKTEFDGFNTPTRIQAVREMLSEVGPKLGLDPSLGMAVVKAESSFNTQAISSDGFASKGLFQLLDTTGQEIHQQSGYMNPYDPHDPGQNVELGMRYLSQLFSLFSSDTQITGQLRSQAAANSSSLEKLSVAAFNAGQGRVAQAQARVTASGGNAGNFDEVAPYLPESTREYVNRVMGFRNQFRTPSVMSVGSAAEMNGMLASSLHLVSGSGAKGSSEDGAM